VIRIRTVAAAVAVAALAVPATPAHAATQISFTGVALFTPGPPCSPSCLDQWELDGTASGTDGAGFEKCWLEGTRYPYTPVASTLTAEMYCNGPVAVYANVVVSIVGTGWSMSGSAVVQGYETGVQGSGTLAAGRVAGTMAFA
jgi:hypothetical protein